MYLRIATLNSNSLLIESGDGPRVLGQTTNNSWYRIAASLLAAIGSSVPDSLIAIISEKPTNDLPNPWFIRGGGSIDEMAIEAAQRLDQHGWIRRPDAKPGAIFLLYSREDIEDGVYHTLRYNRCYLVPGKIREHAQTFKGLNESIASLALCELEVTDDDILIEFKDQAILNAVVTSVARIVTDFNQE